MLLINLFIKKSLLVVSGTGFFLPLISPFHIPAMLFSPKLHLKHNFNSNRLFLFRSPLLFTSLQDYLPPTGMKVSFITFRNMLEIWSGPSMPDEGFSFPTPCQHEHQKRSLNKAIYQKLECFFLLRSETYVKLRENQGPLVNVFEIQSNPNTEY